MLIEAASREHLPKWAAMRSALWPEAAPSDHQEELALILSGGDGRLVAFVAMSDDRELIGFAEASLRGDHVNGCDTTPVAFLEGVFVRPDYRRTGVARALCEAVETWGRAKGCVELGSDADLANNDGVALHAGLGFEERERVVFFRKFL